MRLYQRQLIDVLSPLAPSRVVEVGVYRGRTSRLLLRRFPEVTVLMVDPWRAVPEDHPYRATDDPLALLTQDEHDANYETAMATVMPYRPRFEVLRMPSVEAAAHEASESADAVFVDGDHSYEAACDDLSAWWPIVRPGGVLCGHDFGCRRRPNRKPHGVLEVSRAVREFCDAHRLAFQVGSGTVWWIEKPGNRKTEKPSL